jgi:hypothetical protein
MAKAKEAERTALPPLVITPEKGLSADGNFQQILEYLKRREKEIAKMQLSEDNLEQAKLIMKEAGAYQKAAEERVKTTIALLFDGPKDVLKSKAQELYNAIARLKSSAEKVIDKVEDDRIADLNRAFEAYKTTFQALYQLNESNLTAIELRKWYYNKTPPGNEKKAKDDLEQQFKDRRQALDAYLADVKMIEELCASDDRLRLQTWLDRLERVSVSIVAAEIAAEKERLAGVDRRAAEAERDELAEEGDNDRELDQDDLAEEGNDDREPEAAEVAVVDDPRATPLRLGVLADIAAFKADFPGRMSKKRFELEYPCETGELITGLFKELRQYGVTARAIKEEVAF